MIEKKNRLVRGLYLLKLPFRGFVLSSLVVLRELKSCSSLMTLLSMMLYMPSWSTTYMELCVKLVHYSCAYQFMEK
jgi:hypothetical protein